MTNKRKKERKKARNKQTKKGRKKERKKHRQNQRKKENEDTKERTTERNNKRQKERKKERKKTSLFLTLVRSSAMSDSPISFGLERSVFYFLLACCLLAPQEYLDSTVGICLLLFSFSVVF